ncbi:MAG: hypothetical protein WBV82_14245, partial [Myxococcaceae bacterium]
PTRPEALPQVRAAMNVDATRLSRARAEGLGTQDEKLTGRVLDLIVKDLSAELSARGEQRAVHAPASGLDAEGGLRSAPKHEPTGPQSQGLGQGQPQMQMQMPSQGAATSQPPSPALKAQAAVELVRRIEVFMKTDRPALALTLSGAISAKVEVERTGKGEVALRIQGTRGPPPPEDVARIREELLRRGLKVSSLSVAGSSSGDP